MVSQIAAVKKEANTEMMERTKMGSNKIRIRNLAKSHAKRSLNGKKSRVQCPSCLHCVFEGTILCSCGKHQIQPRDDSAH